MSTTSHEDSRREHRGPSQPRVVRAPQRACWWRRDEGLRAEEEERSRGEGQGAEGRGVGG